MMMTIAGQDDLIAPRAVLPLGRAADLDPLLERIADAQYVLLGEASHGTHEYYTWRAELSRRLIREKGFSFIAVEGDWPECFEINRWVKQYPGTGNNIVEVLRQQDRWPTWMWANWEIAALSQWMRKHNSSLPAEKKIGFYGLDVYSLWDSMKIIVDYLEKEDPAAAAYAKRAIDCFEPYGEEEAYAAKLRAMKKSCREEVLRLLLEVRQNAGRYGHEPEAGLNAEINALVAANGEKYYRTMSAFGGVALRYDAFLYLDETRALHPLHLKPDSHLMPQTFPFGLCVILSALSRGRCTGLWPAVRLWHDG